MRGNLFGNILSMVSFGESHGKAMGVVIDGVPPNLEISIEDLQKLLDRRRPGQLGSSPRNEPDIPQVLSGIFEGKTLGTPIAVIVYNEDARSSDYSKEMIREGHADKTTLLKYGVRDHRGGGRSSGRETVSRVIGGYFSSLIIPKIEIVTTPHYSGFEESEHDTVADYFISLQKEGKSVGGVLHIAICNMPSGLGEPVFDKLKADLAKAVLSIGGCTSFSYSKGILGGISDGNDIEISCSFKPTSTTGKNALMGRHDPCIMFRAIPVVESMINFTIADHYLRQQTYRNIL